MELARLFNECFAVNVSEASIRAVVFYRGLLKGKPKVRRYTPDEIDFIKKNVYGRGYSELVKLFNARFCNPITVSQINSFIGNRRLNTGRTGHFHNGHIPFNKGKKGVYYPGAEKGWFKPGQMPVTLRPVGSERINVDGYVEIKVSNPKRWRHKHVVVWEEANGQVPKGHLVIFLDGNKLNLALDNLMMISRQAHAVMWRMNGYTSDKDTTKANCLIASIKTSISSLKRQSFKNIESEKLVFLDNAGKRVLIAHIAGKEKWVAARDTEYGLRRLKAKLKPRDSLEAAQCDLYEYALYRGWQRV